MAVPVAGWRWKAGLWAAGALLLAASLALFALLPPFGGLITLVPLALAFLPWFRAGFVQAAPESVLAYLAHDFRMSSRIVALGPGEITVRLDKWASVKIRAQPREGGSILSYQTYATPSGWGVLILLFLVIWPAPFAIIPTLVIFHRVVAAVERRVAPIVREGRLPDTFRPDDIRVMLLSSLGEGHRLALESYEAERDRYHDALGVVVLLAMLGWFLLFLAFGFLLADPDWGRRTMNAFLISLGGTLAFGILAGLLVRSRFRPTILRHREWVSRLETALRRESSREPIEAGLPGTFDLLWRASEEVPRWIATQSRAGLDRDPAIWGILFIAAWWGIQLMIFGVPLLLFPAYGNPVVGAALVAAGVGLLLAADRLYRRWRRRRDEELTRMRDGWSRQYDALRNRMEQFLQDL